MSTGLDPRVFENLLARPTGWVMTRKKALIKSTLKSDCSLSSVLCSQPQTQAHKNAREAKGKRKIEMGTLAFLVTAAVADTQAKKQAEKGKSNSKNRNLPAPLAPQQHVSSTMPCRCRILGDMPCCWNPTHAILRVLLFSRYILFFPRF